MTEHVVDWRFEGATMEREANAAGPALERTAHALLELLAAPDAENWSAPRELSLLLCDDGLIAPLNAQWRGVDKATDVLSFPLDEGAQLGDVVISVETAAQRVKGDEWLLEDELAFLLLHGLLHLLGYDHIEPDQRSAMEAEEQRLWTALGRAGTLREPV